jgi:hypothetical protein
MAADHSRSSMLPILCGLPPESGGGTILEWEHGYGPIRPVAALLSLLSVASDRYPIDEEIISESDAASTRPDLLRLPGHSLAEDHGCVGPEVFCVCSVFFALAFAKRVLHDERARAGHGAWNEARAIRRIPSSAAKPGTKS